MSDKVAKTQILSVAAKIKRMVLDQGNIASETEEKILQDILRYADRLSSWVNADQSAKHPVISPSVNPAFVEQIRQLCGDIPTFERVMAGVIDDKTAQECINELQVRKQEQDFSKAPSAPSAQTDPKDSEKEKPANTTSAPSGEQATEPPAPAPSGNGINGGSKPAEPGKFAGSKRKPGEASEKQIWKINKLCSEKGLDPAPYLAKATSMSTASETINELMNTKGSAA